MITLYPSTMMGALLDHPIRQAIGSGFKNGTVGVTSPGPVCWAVLILVSPGLGFGWECGGLLLAGVAVASGAEPYFLGSPRLVQS